MTTENLTLMTGLLKKIDWLEERQKVLAQNIANADTPNYQAQDVAPLDFKELVDISERKTSLRGTTSIAAPALAATDSSHMGLNGSSPSGARVDVKKSKNPYEISPAGNGVVLEEQLLKMGENYSDHRMMTNLYQKNVDMIKLSLKSQ